MAATIYRAQVSIPMFTGKPRDVITNTFHFADAEDPPNPEASLADILEQLQEFYETAYGSDSQSYAIYCNWPMATLKIADVAQPTPRTIYEANMGFAAANGASAVPTEVAIVASWRAAPLPGVRYQSLYNRVYLGGLPNVISNAATNAFPVIAPTVITKINLAMQGMWTSTLSPRLCKWIQWGKSGAGGTYASREIIGGFTDNSPDTQRRRSVDYSIRTDWVPVP
uniref:Uncharacterized protein n=1 Tax=uncultured prokaryote TaxID=198431 RepID=A0A0H5Q5P8_9ZZZZ|nr:hypothetical protein [uncultured prokaryote]